VRESYLESNYRRDYWRILNKVGVIFRVSSDG